MNIASMIDHTLLKPEATLDQIKTLCTEAKEFGFASVCVQPYWVSVAAQELDHSEVAVCTVVGFPLGMNTKEVKAYETVQAVQKGATEIDMVVHIGALKSGEEWIVLEDIQAVISAAQGCIVKVILETGGLTDEEIIRGCELAKQAGVSYVKTSTGFGSGGATVHAVQIMKETVGTQMGIKASGGIRDLQTAEAMVAAGATRLGTSSGVAIVKGMMGKDTY